MTATQPKPVTKESDPFLTAFARFEAPGSTRQPAWLLPLRKAGLARFAELGFPTVHHEDWRFTNLAPLTRLAFTPVFERTDELSAEVLKGVPFATLKGLRLVFVNGLFAPELSTLGATIEGVTITNLANALVTQPDWLQKYLGRYVTTEDNALAALNTAFFLDGAVVHVGAGKVVADPVNLIFLTTTAEAGATVQPRNLIVAEANAQVTVTEHYYSTVKGATFTNAVTEIIAGDRAVVEHVKLQDESAEAFHLATIHGHFGRASHVSMHSIALGARLSRNTIRTKLAGPNLECVLNGLYLAKDEQVADHHMIVEHAEPHCASHEYFNGILDDRSKGVFHGRIYVHPIAQKTDAKQTNKNLLLSDDATADTKPQLEIYADDVRCTHGATIGQLNDESIFYLRARGIGMETARRMLVHAFAGEIIDRVKCEPVREELDKLVWDRLEDSTSLKNK